MKLSRRQFLEHTLLSLAGLWASKVLRPQFLFAEGGSAPSGGKNLVIFVKDGGEDTHFSQPVLNAEFISALGAVRPSLNVSPDQILDVLDGITGLHTNYTPLLPIIQSGNYKIVRACGFQNHSSSHDVASNSFSHAARHLNGKAATQGWPARLKNFYGLNSYQVVGFNTGARLELRSDSPSLLIQNYTAFDFLNRHSAFGGTLESDLSHEVLDALLLKFPTQSSEALKKVSSAHDAVNEAVTLIETVKTQEVGTYPTTGIGGDLQNLAKMMRWRQLNNPQENAIYLVMQSGYDTHSDEASRLLTLITREAEALAAFSNDLKTFGLWNSTVIVGVSEFSRTLRENAGLGTDHAQATSISILGGVVKGGGTSSAFGPVPSAADIKRNYVIPEVYYREVVREIIEWWGVPSSDVSSILIEEPPSRQQIGIFS